MIIDSITPQEMVLTDDGLPATQFPRSDFNARFSLMFPNRNGKLYVVTSGPWLGQGFRSQWNGVALTYGSDVTVQLLADNTFTVTDVTSGGSCTGALAPMGAVAQVVNASLLQRPNGPPENCFEPDDDAYFQFSLQNLMPFNLKNVQVVVSGLGSVAGPSIQFSPAPDQNGNINLSFGTIGALATATSGFGIKTSNAKLGVYPFGIGVSAWSADFPPSSQAAVPSSTGGAQSFTVSE